jgi:PAT family beta-lactamase induction signal transducer AmpG
LLASLTMLIGTLGRPWLGAMIESAGLLSGFHHHLLAGRRCGPAQHCVEWWRQAREARASQKKELYDG